jgi:hypothetical protein
MNVGFSSKSFEPQQGQGLNTRESITGFLARFTTLFTLKQDTLIEQKYVGTQKYNNSKPHGFYRPGFTKSSDRLSVGNLPPIRLYKPADKLELVSGGQAYFKLHGSSDLQDGDRGMMLIMGTISSRRWGRIRCSPGTSSNSQNS